MSKEEIKTYTLKEIEEHNNKDTLWLLIDNAVYDVSKFQDEHPGGPEVLLDYAGKEATDAFESIGHSADARAMMLEYKIGELCQEDRNEKKENGTSRCFRCQMLIPIGVVVAAFLVYTAYSRLRK